MARDAGTKQDQPSDQQGKGTPAKEELETRQAAQEAGDAGGATPSSDPGRSGADAEAAAEEKPKRKRTTRKKAEGAAAEETGVDKAAAEAALSEGSTEAPAAPEEAEEAEEKPKRKRAPRKKAEAAEDEPAEKGAEAKEPEAAAEEPGAAEEPSARKPAAQPSPRRAAEREPAERITVRARARFVRTSARKARLVAEHVRGKSVEDARAVLAFHPRSVAEDWRKLLDSAVANAEHNHDLVGDDLRVLSATADEGPTLKRFRPRALGRATRIRKRTSHLTIELTPKEN